MSLLATLRMSLLQALRAPRNKTRSSRNLSSCLTFNRHGYSSFTALRPGHSTFSALSLLPCPLVTQPAMMQPHGIRSNVSLASPTRTRHSGNMPARLPSYQRNKAGWACSTRPGLPRRRTGLPGRTRSPSFTNAARKLQLDASLNWPMAILPPIAWPRLLPPPPTFKHRAGVIVLLGLGFLQKARPPLPLKLNLPLGTMDGNGPLRSYSTSPIERSCFPPSCRALRPCFAHNPARIPRPGCLPFLRKLARLCLPSISTWRSVAGSGSRFPSPTPAVALAGSQAAVEPWIP